VQEKIVKCQKCGKYCRSVAGVKNHVNQHHPELKKTQGKCEILTISVPSSFIEKINKYLEKINDESRSSWIVKAIEAYMESEDKNA
jgi:glycerol-3-phosphate dehydrogenase